MSLRPLLAAVMLVASLHVSASLPPDSLGWALANVAVASLRTSPSHPSQLETQVTHGTPMKVVADSLQWLNVLTPDGYKAWIPASLVTRLSNSAFASWQGAPKLMVVSRARNIIRSDSLPHAPVVSDCLPGALFCGSLTPGSQWASLTLPDGRRGYLPASHVEDFTLWSQHLPDTAAMLCHAADFMGVAYLWGGTTLAAVDCSGFTRLLYAWQGVILPRNASAQAGCGVEVSTDSLQPGDLLFFASEDSADTSGRITHVGIYEGGSCYIHASGLVHRSSFRPGHPLYNGRPVVKAVRILPLPAAGASTFRSHPWFGLN